MKQTILLQGLNCPNCAARIEADVKKLPAVKDAQLNLMKQTLMLEAEKDLLKQIEAIVHTYEPDVKVRLKEEGHIHEESLDIKAMLLRMGIGAAVFALGIFWGDAQSVPVGLGIYIVAYLILGYDVVLSAVRNIVKGRVFDENFLMSLSSIGAFFIGEHPEGVAVMLFFDWKSFHQTGIELAKEVRKRLPSFVTLIYQSPFEDVS